MATSFINIKGLTKRISEVQHELARLLHLQSFVGGSSGKKPGRPSKAKTVKTVKSSKPAKRARKSGKRGALGEKILSFLKSKGKTGAHVKDIASAVGAKPTNITAWTYATGKNKVKKVSPATFAIKE